MITRYGIILCVDIRQIIMAELDRRDMTQLRLSQLTGILPHRISEYLSGQRDVNAETLRKMLEALQLEIRPKRTRKGR